MLPYPSGALHMGHVRNYSIGDALARYMWMNGYNVLHPMGWDSFGLPAENAAIQNNTPPREWTLAQHRQHEGADEAPGLCLRLVARSHYLPARLLPLEPVVLSEALRKGLAYRKKSKVNWCPKCATVLANEQVVDGRCWRHEDTLVEQRELEQWFLRITKYAEELLRDLDKLEGLAGKSPHHAAQLDRPQRRHAGRFQTRRTAGAAGSTITVFTTRVDTIFGATSIQLAPRASAGRRFARNDPRARVKVDELDRRATQSQRSGRHRRNRKAWREHRPLRDQSV